MGALHVPWSAVSDHIFAYRYQTTDRHVAPLVAAREIRIIADGDDALFYRRPLPDPCRGDLDQFRPAGSAFPGVHSEVLCEAEPHGAFDALQGVWRGTATDATGDESYATFAAGILVDGCGVAGVLDAKSIKTFVTFGYVDRYEHWLSYSLDSREATPHRYMIAAHADNETTFTEAPDLAIKDELTLFSGTEFLDTSQGLARRIWKFVGDDKLLIRDEQRASSVDPWTLALAYRLQRQ